MSTRLEMFDTDLNIISIQYGIDKYNLVELLIDYHKLPVNEWIDKDDLLHRVLNNRTKELIEDINE